MNLKLSSKVPTLDYDVLEERFFEKIDPNLEKKVVAPAAPTLIYILE